MHFCASAAGSSAELQPALGSEKRGLKLRATPPGCRNAPGRFHGCTAITPFMITQCPGNVQT
jgi:hypothetical protein